jgi:hypothetical protein
MNLQQYCRGGRVMSLSCWGVVVVALLLASSSVRAETI